MGRIYVLLVLYLFLNLLQYCCCSTSSNMSCNEMERESLLKFKKGLNDESNLLSSWVGNDCCNWHGVGCSKSTGRVIKLDLHNPYDYFYDAYNYQYYSLGGEVNPLLLNLRYLNYLDLSGNNFSGPIPKFFGSFKDLVYMNLSFSGFSGKVPTNLGNLSNLHYLDLNTAGRLLSVDSLKWASSLYSLKHLALSWVDGIRADSDWLLALNMIPSLEVLNLAQCSITSIPPLLHVNFTSLASLDLSFNIINSTIPLWLSNITSLKQLHLQNNQIHGLIPDFPGLVSLTILDVSENSFDTSLPESLSNLSSLVYLDIRYNKFQGSLPLRIGDLKQLSYLGINTNKLSGSIPPSLGQLSKLQNLDISNNDFNGSIPTSLGQLSKLTELSIRNNKLSGSIPTSLGQLSKLETLDIRNNPLDGNLSENHFSKLKMLKILRMSSNLLGFNVSLNWTTPFQLTTLRIESCKNIGPKFPQWLQTQSQLEELSVSNSSISDSIPDWFENVTSFMNRLDLSHNQIRGKLPKLQTALQYLLMSNNNLTGFVPMNICKMNSVSFLDLSNNKFSGRLPSCLGNLINLKVLDLTNNSLRGHLPSSLGSLSNLQSLHLHNNRFEGNLPLSLQNLTALETLSLGVNLLTGILPPWIGEKLYNLKRLSLQSNWFEGEIPLQLCNLTSLKLLDLAHNRLTGNIPHCIGNLTGMIVMDNYPYNGWYFDQFYIENIFSSVQGTERLYTKTIGFVRSIDISNNNIDGRIPEGLVDLLALEGINFSGNRLNGRIPKMIGNLKQLETLDLSRNKLSGPIPQSLSFINSLSHLNLSFNELSGRVPTGQQLQTLNDPTIYEGNSGLCGAPDMKSCPGNNDEPPPAHESDESDHIWFYAGLAPGFVVGFLGICGVLVFKESWRHPFFLFFENVFNWLQRKFHPHQPRLQHDIDSSPPYAFMEI